MLSLPFSFAAMHQTLNRYLGLMPEPGPTNPPSRLGLLALGIAREEIGHGEAGRNNYGADVVRYRLGIDDGTAWCASFVSFCFLEAAKQLGGIDLPFTPSHSAKRLFKRMGNSGYFIPAEMVQPGDVACWHRGAHDAATGHVGIVSQIKGVKFSTIEGNRGAFPSYVDDFEHVHSEGGLLGFARCLI